MKLTHFDSEHFLAKADAGLSPLLPEDARNFFDRELSACGDCDGGIVATLDNGRIVGFMRYQNEAGENSIMYGCGTWVDPEYRKQGLAFDLWLGAIEDLGPSVIDWVAVSEGGRRLFNSLEKFCRQNHLSVQWDYCDGTHLPPANCRPDEP